MIGWQPSAVSQWSGGWTSVGGMKVRGLYAKERRIADLEAFAGLPARSIRRFAGVVDEVELAPGQLLLRPVGYRRHLYLVADGVVTATPLPAERDGGTQRGGVEYRAATWSRVLILDMRYLDFAVSIAPRLGALISTDILSPVLHLRPAAGGGEPPATSQRLP